MTKTTRAQRIALKAVFDRVPLYLHLDLDGQTKVSSLKPLRGLDGQPLSYLFISTDGDMKLVEPQPITYQHFRRRVHPTFGCDEAVVIQWCGMWLIIETDGHVHS